jgi:hypothetical protein
MAIIPLVFHDFFMSINNGRGLLNVPMPVFLSSIHLLHILFIYINKSAYFILNSNSVRSIRVVISGSFDVS